MVKKNSGRDLNPADAFRKTQRAKEIARNKKERTLQREALKQRDDPETLREQLREVLAAEQQGKMNPTLRLKKKALQHAYDQAIKRKMEEEAASRTRGRGLEEIAAEEVRQPQDSVYYHPMLNPLGIPPPGKPQKYKDDADTSSLPIPVPKQPPLPLGLPPPPSNMPPQPLDMPAPLPPPPGPPPGVAIAPLPPPPGPPPGAPAAAPLPPPPGPPPGGAPAQLAEPLLPPPIHPPANAVEKGQQQLAPLPPPPMPPPPMPPPYGYMPHPHMYMPPGALHHSTISRPASVSTAPPVPPPVPAGGEGAAPAAPLSAEEEQQRQKAATIVGQSTAVPLPKAHQDKRVTALVPASVAVRREMAHHKPVVRGAAGAGPGFGLVPRTVQQQPQQKQQPLDSSYKDFLSSMRELGAV